MALSDDVLIGVNGQLFNQLDELTGTIGSSESGSILRLDLMRGGKRIVRNVALGPGAGEGEVT